MTADIKCTKYEGSKGALDPLYDTKKPLKTIKFCEVSKIRLITFSLSSRIYLHDEK